jgi:hypothetical protein
MFANKQFHIFSAEIDFYISLTHKYYNIKTAQYWKITVRNLGLYSQNFIFCKKKKILKPKLKLSSPILFLTLPKRTL